MPRPEPLLRLEDRFTHLVESAEASVLVGDEDAVVMENQVASDVVRLLDGRRTALEIARILEGQHRPELVHFVLIAFERNGICVEVSRGDETRTGGPGSGTMDGLAADLWEGWPGTDGKRAACFPLADDDWSGIPLVLTDDYLNAEVPKVLSDIGGSALLARVGRSGVWVGPLIRSRDTACIACLTERLQLNLSARALLHVDGKVSHEKLSITRLANPIPRAAFELLADTIGAVRDPGDLHDRLLARRVGADEAESHPVSRLPNCPVCGDPDLAPPGASFRLRSRSRVRGSGSGYRILDPAETLRRFSPLISPLTGVVRHVRKVPVEGTGLVHVYTASHSHYYRATTIRAVKSDSRDHSGGKGATDLDAKVSALCESLERFSAVRRGQEPVRLARRSELGADALDPNALMHFSQRQLEHREAWNAQETGGFHWIPEPYGDEPIEWSPARSLLNDRTWWVPSAFIYLGFKGEGSRFCKGDSNGLAGGNCLEEAILQGFCELVERDAVALWWYNRAGVPGIDLEGAQDPYVRSLAHYYPSLGRSLWALDLTTDVGVPCFVALSALRADGRDIIFGFGAHLDARIALRRALTEVNQMLPTIQRTPEERRQQLLPDFADAIRWWESESLDTQPYLLPGRGLPQSDLSRYQEPTGEDLLDLVQDCAIRAGAAATDLLVHDLTRPSVGFSVAKVITPGLRHFWRRLGPGRLYDVPPHLGWHTDQPPEQGMNPLSVFV